MTTVSDEERGVDKGVRILSLDNGGPGTHSQLLIIKEYMARLANDRGIDEGGVYPADYFDLIGGVGFGGLVAICLGHLRMNVDEAIESVQDVALAVFPDNNQPKIDPETRMKQLGESLKGILQARGIPPDRKMQDTGEDFIGCKVALYTAAAADLSHPVVLRNYRHRGSSLNPTIVEAICATMATPPYLSPIKFGPRGRQQAFKGGPRGANNPTRELLKEAGTIFGEEKLVAQIVSLGCGCSHVSSVQRDSHTEGVDRSVQEIAVDCEAVAKELSTRLYDMEEYLRLNVERGMENLAMNDWDDLGPIETHTGAYVERVENSETIEGSLGRLQGITGSVTLGDINHPRAAMDVEDNLDRQKEELARTSKSVKDTDDSRLLERLNPVNAPSYYESRRCMKDTRTYILDHIISWAATPSEKNSPSNDSDIFWVYGSPGLGKTSVANSLCHRLHGTGNLGGSFFCRRDDPVLCDPNRVLPTLLYRLSWMWAPYRELVVQALRADPNLNPDWTGCAVLLEHLYSLQDRPKAGLVLVVDALDESGDPPTRVQLLKSFSSISSRVDWLKIILTSRPEHDIHSFFQKLHLAGHDLSKDNQAHQDIRNFTRYRMDLVASRCHLPSDWPGEPRLEEIARRSGGLFIFVETLYQLLNDPDPEPLLDQVLGGMLGEANAELHKLYSTTIKTRIGRNKEHFRLFAQAVVAVATHRPLPDKTLASLIGLETRVISTWVDSLSSLLYRDMSENGGIRARHLSVIEFLTGPTCPPEFRVDLQQANAQLGHRCLITMTDELRFNICELETSCVPNADIQDLSNRVRDKISDALQYSCMHWSSHLCSGSAPMTIEASEQSSRFLSGAQLLYWLEALSLMGKVPTAISALRLLKPSFMKVEGHERLVEDVLRFVLAFFTPISTSAPHIYISGLAFMPVESGLCKHTSRWFPGLLTVCKGRMQSWPAPSGVWQGHTSYVHSVAYSPDGLNVISGSHDKTIRIWDAQTGAAVGEPLRGHSGAVFSVAYSPDGRSVISGSDDMTIRIWDAQTGAAVGEPLTGHTGRVFSVAYSPDGRSVVSGSGDRTVRMWNAETGASIGEPLRGHTGDVTSVAYSPDGGNIISGSGDHTMRIWEAQTGAAVGEPLSGHAGRVLIVTYSPDGQNVVSGAENYTIRIWNVQTRTTIGEPLMGHTGKILGITYSPDGQNIISGSSDPTIRIWDARTGASVREIPRAHSDWVRSVAYSPDGQNFISGSDDTTIRIWDAQTGVAVREPLRGNSVAVRSVACSPGGRSVVSGSENTTIRIWDAQTGAAVGEPLRGHSGAVLSLAYSPDDRNIISGSADGTIRIWDAHTRAAVGKPLSGHTGTVFGVAYSPDGRSIVSGSKDTTVRIWDAQTGAAVGEPLRGHTDEVNSVAYSPDGQNIISGSDDRTIRIWKAQTGAAVGEPLTGHTDLVRSVAYSPDGRTLVSGSDDSTVRIWNSDTGKAIGEPLKGHTDLVLSVAYSPDGQYIISGSADRTIRLWNAQNGEAVGEPLMGHPGWVRSVAYSPDGQQIISGSNNNTIRIWNAQTNTGQDGPGVLPAASNLSSLHPINAFSGLPIPSELLDSNGWVHGPDGLLFWVPEDCRHGLTCPAIMTIPTTARQRCVRIDFTRFQYGTSWTNIRGSNE